MGQLFEKCSLCDGTRRTVADAMTGRAVPVERCPSCNGRRKVCFPAAPGGPNSLHWVPCDRCEGIPAGGMVPEVLPAGSVCPGCRDGYCQVGMSARQLEVMHEEHDRLLEFADRVYSAAVAVSLGMTGAETALHATAEQAGRAPIVPNLSARAAEYRARRAPRAPLR